MSRLGAIADDFTGATDLATNLAGRGFDVVVVTENGLAAIERDPAIQDELRRFEAVVVALKTRTAPTEDAVASSLRALSALQLLGAERFYDKYCSTFDSTDDGNIGQILDALTAALGVDTTVVVPSFPDNGRTVQDGVLYVHGIRLEDSSMRTHPLTPMTKSRVADLLHPQSNGTVTELHSPIVDAGPEALSGALEQVDARYVVVDAATDAHLATIAEATATAPLVSGGSGLALGLSPVSPRSASPMAATSGRRIVLAGSASTATQGQVRHAIERMPSRKVDVLALAADQHGELVRITEWASALPAHEPVLVYAVAEPADVIASFEGDGEASSSSSSPAPSALVEELLAGLAQTLSAPERGFTQFVVAGGETSGAVVTALGLDQLVIGPRVAPGVCWASGTTSAGTGSGVSVNVALKSGNFGAEDLFTTAWKELHA